MRIYSIKLTFLHLTQVLRVSNIYHNSNDSSNPTLMPADSLKVRESDHSKVRKGIWFHTHTTQYEDERRSYTDFLEGLWLNELVVHHKQL